ncbi:SCP-like protein [Oesophagostomum dentatum]|uniref:SCP-like protein n=1 Tax=Oesophagostomum dentatum TaxID=61180 RepID=A0A0B1TQQ8_OESDE|nr:SCP-like protein [Oesophagostomum dentatum]
MDTSNVRGKYEKVYCCELERSAYERAKQCNSMDSSLFGDVENNKNFTKNLNRTLEEAGKNVQAIQMWWAEIRTYGPIDQIQNIFYTHLGISSFAKIASDLTTGVGCSIVHCGSSINVVCHYETTLKNAVKLYNCGPYCNQCPGGRTACVNGLCPVTDGQCPASTAATTGNSDCSINSVSEHQQHTHYNC